MLKLDPKRKITAQERKDRNPNTRNFSDEEIEYIIKSYLENKKSANDIGEEMNCGKSLILRILKNNKIKRRTFSEFHETDFSKNEINDMVKMFRDKISLAKIGEKYNCSWLTIQKTLIKNGINAKFRNQSRTKWTKEDVKLFNTLMHHNLPRSEIKKYFPDKTLRAIDGKIQLYKKYGRIAFGNGRFIPFEEIKDKKFGLLTPIKEINQLVDNIHNKRMILCKCDCGNEKIISFSYLSSNDIKSCGCLKNKNGNKSKYWNGYEEISATYFNHIKDNAIKRGLSFEVTIEQLWNLYLQQNKKCYLSGIDLKFNESVRNKNGNISLDRINSNLGYTIDNVAWCHKKINIMKMDIPKQNFINLCKMIVDYNS